MAENMVTITKNGKEFQAVESAFELVWKPRGWKLKGEKPLVSVPAPKVEQKSSTESATP